MRGERKTLMGNDGFTLLEVLVAFVLLATAVTVVLQLFSANFKTLSTSEEYINAVIKAESVMREVLGNDDLVEKMWSETTPEGYRIDIRVHPVHQERTRDLPLKLLEIDLTVSWRSGAKERSVRVRTIKAAKQEVTKA